MARTAYVVGSRIERDRRSETMPGVDIVLAGSVPMGVRWDRIILGRGFLQRFREAAPAQRRAWRAWVENDVVPRVAAGGELMGQLPDERFDEA